MTDINAIRKIRVTINVGNTDDTGEFGQRLLDLFREEMGERLAGEFPQTSDIAVELRYTRPAHDFTSSLFVEDGDDFTAITHDDYPDEVVIRTIRRTITAVWQNTVHVLTEELNAVLDAKDAWTGCDWTHGFPVAGEYVHIEPSLEVDENAMMIERACAGRIDATNKQIGAAARDATAYAERAARAAESAAQFGDRAYQALSDGP